MPAPTNIVRWFKDDADCLSVCGSAKNKAASVRWYGWEPFSHAATYFTRYRTLTVTWVLNSYLSSEPPGGSGTAVFTINPFNGSIDFFSSTGSGGAFPFKDELWTVYYNEANATIVDATHLEYNMPFQGNALDGTYVHYALSDPHTINDVAELVNDLMDLHDLTDPLDVAWDTRINISYAAADPALVCSTCSLYYSRYLLPIYWSTFVRTTVTPVVVEATVGFAGNGSYSGQTSFASVAPEYTKIQSYFPYNGPYCQTTATSYGSGSPTSVDANGTVPDSPCLAGILNEPPVLDHSASPMPLIAIKTVHLNSQQVGTTATGYFRAKNSGALNPVWNFSDGSTVTIGSVVYTFKTTLTNVAGYVLLGTTYVAAIRNLVAAINGAAGSGTTYAAATTAHPNVTATELDVTGVTATVGNKVCFISAKAPDDICSTCASGNSIALVSSTAFLLSGAPYASPYNGNGAGTLLGGVNAANGTCTDLTYAQMLNA